MFRPLIATVSPVPRFNRRRDPSRAEVVFRPAMISFGDTRTAVAAPGIRVSNRDAPERGSAIRTVPPDSTPIISSVAARRSASADRNGEGRRLNARGGSPAAPSVLVSRAASEVVPAALDPHARSFPSPRNVEPGGVGKRVRGQKCTNRGQWSRPVERVAGENAHPVARTQGDLALPRIETGEVGDHVLSELAEISTRRERHESARSAGEIQGISAICHERGRQGERGKFLGGGNRIISQRPARDLSTGPGNARELVPRR